jgi:hypothetical protein
MISPSSEVGSTIHGIGMRDIRRVSEAGSPFQSGRDSRNFTPQLVITALSTTDNEKPVRPTSTPYPVRSTRPSGGAGRFSGKPRDRAADQEHHSLERHGHGGARQPPRKRASAAIFPPMPPAPPFRGGLQPFFPGQNRPTIRATSSISRAMPRRGCMPAPSGRAHHGKQLENFRRELPEGGLPSYPHPYLMPTSGSFRPSPWACRRSWPSTRRASTATWKTAAWRTRRDQKVWAFLGDGELDEPESLGAITLAAREQTRQPDLRGQLQPAAPGRAGARQRQDHSGTGGRLPGRRLERDQGDLGRDWDPLLARDEEGLLVQAHGRGARRPVPAVLGGGRDFIRKDFFGKYPNC